MTKIGKKGLFLIANLIAFQQPISLLADGEVQNLTNKNSLGIGMEASIEKLASQDSSQQSSYLGPGLKYALDTVKSDFGIGQIVQHKTLSSQIGAALRLTSYSLLIGILCKYSIGDMGSEPATISEIKKRSLVYNCIYGPIAEELLYTYMPLFAAYILDRVEFDGERVGWLKNVAKLIPLNSALLFSINHKHQGYHGVLRTFLSNSLYYSYLQSRLTDDSPFLPNYVPMLSHIFQNSMILLPNYFLAQ